MKTNLSLILLTFILTTTIVSCSRSESNEIQESAIITENADIRKKLETFTARQAKAAEERNARNLEALASTPEGRKQMTEYLLIAKHSYIENNRFVLKLTLAEALELGLDASSYNRTIQNYAETNHWIDSIEAIPIPANHQKSVRSVNNDIVSQNFEAARNGSHEYYQYLNKYSKVTIPEIRPLRER